ncbi:MAG: HEPN domain-containing protein [Cyclobacteriaceae bacterium]|nr:HEPN domain-containing protein [Cyclobacteriaceae bacterium]
MDSRANDEVLLGALRNDDPNAFEIIYRRYAESLYKYISQKVFTHEDADTVLINGFVSLWNSRKEIGTKNLHDHLLSTMRTELCRYIRNSPDIESYRQSFRNFVTSTDPRNSMQNELPVTDSQKRDFSDTLDVVIPKIRPETIICFGIRSSAFSLWSPFRESEQSLVTTYDLLIILTQGDKNLREFTSEQIKQHSTSTVKFNPISHSSKAVRDAISSGNHFFQTAFQTGILVYGEHQPINSPYEPEAHADSIVRRVNARAKFSLAREFYEVATNCLTKEKYDVSIFTLHQAVELACSAILLNELGYRASSHSLKKLFHLLRNVTSIFVEAFPESTEEEINLLDLLHKAYSDVRYKDNYYADPRLVQAAHGRIDKILNATEDLLKDFLVNGYLPNVK